jgi:oligopeptide/dipeptide ABC transporter ATP-binding protein
MPTVERRLEQLRAIEGSPPSLLHPPPGCPFHPRCPIAVARCSTDVPAIRELGVGHTVACHLAG